LRSCRLLCGLPDVLIAADLDLIRGGGPAGPARQQDLMEIVARQHVPCARQPPRQTLMGYRWRVETFESGPYCGVYPRLFGFLKFLPGAFRFLRLRMVRDQLLEQKPSGLLILRCAQCGEAVS
jgi:hypothetical protein